MNVKNQIFILATTNTATPAQVRFLFNVCEQWADKDDAALLFRLYLEACKR